MTVPFKEILVTFTTPFILTSVEQRLISLVMVGWEEVPQKVLEPPCLEPQHSLNSCGNGAQPGNTNTMFHLGHTGQTGNHLYTAES